MCFFRSIQLTLLWIPACAENTIVEREFRAISLMLSFLQHSTLALYSRTLPKPGWRVVDSEIAIFGYNLIAQHCDIPSKDTALTLLGTGCTLAAEADGLLETLVNAGARRGEANRQQTENGPSSSTI